MGGVKGLVGQERAVSIDDVQAELEAATGVDLDAYFAAWVRGAGRPAWPRARVVVSDVAGMAGMVDVAVTMSSTDGKARGARLSVRLLGAMGAQLDVGPFDFGLNGELVPAPIRVAPGFVVTGTAVDPRAEALVFKGSGGAPGPAPEPLVPYRNLFLAPPRR